MSAVAPVDARTRARLRALRQQVDDIVLPAAVLAEGLLTGHAGRDHHVRRLLSLVKVRNVDELLGLAAGKLRTRAIAVRAKRPPSGVDAIVAAVADAAGGEVRLVTSDPDDIAALLAHADHPGRVAILRA